MPFLTESLRRLRWCACDSASTRQFAPVSSLSAVRESCFVKTLFLKTLFLILEQSCRKKIVEGDFSCFLVWRPPAMSCPPGWSSSASQCYTSPPVEGTWLECAALCTSHSWRGSPAALAVADAAAGTAAAGVAAWTGAFAPNANISGCAYLSSDGGLLEAPCLALFRCVCQWPVPPSVFACSSDGPCSRGPRPRGSGAGARSSRAG